MAAADVLGYGAAIVVIATGSAWRGDGVQPGQPDPIAGADASLPHVLTPEQLAAGKRPPGNRVIVYDTDGYFVAPGVAELLAAEDYRVTLVTSYPVVSPVSDETLEGDMLRAYLHRCGVTARRGVTITAAGPGSASGQDEYGDPWSADCDAVVLVTQQASDDALYRELAGDGAALAACGVQAVHLIGDAVAPRLLSEVVFDGHRLAREIDRPDPSVPVPYLRRGRIDWLTFCRSQPDRSTPLIRPWTLKNQLGPERHGGPVPARLRARIVQRLLALNACIWHNEMIGAPVKRSLIAYDP